MKLTTPYNYPTYSRVDIDGKRHYVTDGYDPVPSVTTILSATKDTTPINEWRDRIGHNNADAIVEEASTIGSSLHENLEQYILHSTAPTGTLMSKILTNLVINNGLQNVDEVWGAEVALYLEGCYAGTADLVGKMINNKTAIIDFKNSSKPKKKEWIEDYFLQGCAYKLAHDELYGTKIDRIIIMIACRTGVYQEFIIEGKEMEDYMDKWMQRIQRYYGLQTDLR